MPHMPNFPHIDRYTVGALTQGRPRDQIKAELAQLGRAFRTQHREHLTIAVEDTP